MKAVEVTLSSGDRFYVDADLERVAAVLGARRLIRLGGRFVNGSQVTHLIVAECPSIFTPETLEQEEAA